MKKAGIIRCQQTEDMCSGTTDFKVATAGTMAFEQTGPVEIIGFVSCGGCPGKRSVSISEMMVKRGADMIVLASCMTKGNPVGFSCPHTRQIIESIRKKVGDTITIVEWTH